MTNTEPILTIAIPTFNRSTKLDAQMKWAVDSIGENWALCQLLISDNASTDETPAVCEKWQTKLGNRLTVFRQPLNLGAIGNFCFCITYALGKYVWTVSDDDPVQIDAVAIILKILQEDNNLGFLHLNHCCVNGIDSSVVYEQYYPWSEDQYASPGLVLIEQCLKHRESALLYITSCIYNREYAIQAIESWQGIENLALPLYINAYVAAQSSMRVTSSVLFDCILYISSWQSRSTCVFYHDVPEVYLCLIKIGYDANLMISLILKPLKLRKELLKTMLTFIINFPLMFLKSLQIYVRAMGLKVIKGNLILTDNSKISVQSKVTRRN